MGIVFRSNVDASAVASKAVTAVTRGLRGMWFFDTSLNKAANDFSLVSDAGAAVIGAPVVQASFTEFTALSNYLQTDIAEPDTFSFAVVMRATKTFDEMAAAAVNRCAVMGNYSGAGLGGIAIGYADVGDIAFGRSMNLEGGGTQMRAAKLGLLGAQTLEWRLVRGRYDAASAKVVIKDETRGVSVQTNSALSPLKAATPLRVGSMVSAFQTGPVQLSQLRFFDAELAEAEFTDVVAEMRRYELTHNNRIV